jgi:hypothetical protein
MSYTNDWENGKIQEYNMLSPHEAPRKFSEYVDKYTRFYKN